MIEIDIQFRSFLIWWPLCLSASVFLASAPSRVGESLHFRKHCQQRLDSRHHNSIRWGVQTQAVVFPASYLLARPVNPVTFLLFQAEKVKSNQFRANLHLPFCLRNNVPTKQRWFGLLLEIIGITSVGPSLYSGVVGAELTSTNVSIFITSDAGNTWREVTVQRPLTVKSLCDSTKLFLLFATLFLKW